MKILLHVCCGPCSIYPLSSIENDNLDVTGYFFNPNIHPYKEFRRRINACVEYFSDNNIPLLLNEKYGLIDFLRSVVFDEQKRCFYCYNERLEKTAKKAKENGFDSFSTTLLYSKFQNHQKIKSLCESLEKKYSISFHYRDFRLGWLEAIEKSKELNMYRQPYCGCIYSEQERYDKSFRKKTIIKAT